MSRATPPKSVRGFAVLAVMVVGVVAIALSLTLLTSFGTSASAQQTDDVVRRTDAAMGAAVARTAAWLDEIAAADGDLDRALSASDTCTLASTQAFVLPFGLDAGLVFGSATYTHLSFHGVETYVKIYDNHDDGAMGTERSAGPCAEGADRKRGDENLARDHDRRVWIVVIAEVTGADPAAAPRVRRVKRALYDGPEVYLEDLPSHWVPTP